MRKPFEGGKLRIRGRKRQTSEAEPSIFAVFYVRFHQKETNEKAT